MHLQESGEMYLETILILSEKLGAVRSLDIAEYMGYSKPSISRAVGLLKNGGFINVAEDGHITLTDSGTEVARFLLGLGVDAETAAEDACKMEHYISDTSFEAIKSSLGGE